MSERPILREYQVRGKRRKTVSYNLDPDMVARIERIYEVGRQTGRFHSKSHVVDEALSRIIPIYEQAIAVPEAVDAVV